MCLVRVSGFRITHIIAKIVLTLAQTMTLSFIGLINSGGFNHRPEGELPLLVAFRRPFWLYFGASSGCVSAPLLVVFLRPFWLYFGAPSGCDSAPRQVVFLRP